MNSHVAQHVGNQKLLTVTPRVGFFHAKGQTRLKKYPRQPKKPSPVTARSATPTVAGTQNEALVLLHEVAHFTDALGKHTQQESDSFSLDIDRDCFGKKELW